MLRQLIQEYKKMFTILVDMFELLLSMSKKWFIEYRFPYTESFHCNNLAEYAEVYNWLQENVGNTDKNVWVNLVKQKVLTSGSTVSDTTYNGTIRFKDSEVAVMYRLRFIQ